MNKDLVTRISALQELVTKQTSQLEVLRIDRQLVLEENKLMKEQINSLSVNLSALRDCTKIVNDFTHVPQPMTSSQAQMQQNAGVGTAKW